MKTFIKKILKQGKIKLITPNDNIANEFIKKSDNSIISSKALYDINQFDDSTTLTYYSMYNSALALLYGCGIKSQNHTATIFLLKDLFEIDNDAILAAKKERIDKQYYIKSKATKKEALAGINSAEEFNDLIKERIDKLKEKEKQIVNLKFKEKYV